MYYALDHPGTTVTFNIPTSDPGFAGGVFTIQPTDNFPGLMRATVLDGSTQPGNSNPNGPEIVLNGALYGGPTGNAGALGSRVLNALSLNRVTAVIGILNCITNLIFDYVFMMWLGLPGIALATSAVYFCSSLVILFVVQRRLAHMCRGESLAIGEA